MLKVVIFRFFIALLIIVLGLTVLLYGVYSIDNKYVASNVLGSTDVLREEGEYPTKFVSNYFFRLDNYTDFRMIDIAISGEKENSLQSAFLNYEDYGPGSMADGIDAMAKGYKKDEHNPYSRYWHSYIVYLKPILIFLNYKEIRILNFVTFYVSLLFLFYLIVKKIGLDIAVVFLLSLLPFNLILVPMSMFFMICFMTMIVSSIILLTSSKCVKGANLYLSFFIIGAIISSLDLLSTPQITFGVPFILYILYKCPRNPFLQLIYTGFSWVVGYTMTWSLKFFV